MKSNWRYRAKWFFLEKINWCHAKDRNGNDKPQSWFYAGWCWLFWPIPWQEPQPCWCCASVRGVIYGLLLGGLTGFSLARWIYGCV